MQQLMKLIIGLGNPGKEYEKTRHNAGFLAVDKIIENFQFSIFNFQLKFNAEISQGIINNEKVISVKPQTFMNGSGQAVKAIADYYKIKPEDIIVIHDDLDIPLGKYKISKGKSSAGHKGVQSIIDLLGTKNFTRIRIGIGAKQIPNSKFQIPNSKNSLRPAAVSASGLRREKAQKTRILPQSSDERLRQGGKDFVLEKFGKEEMGIIEKVIEEIVGEIVTLLIGKHQKTIP